MKYKPTIYIAASLERADWLNFETEIVDLQNSGVDILHIDVMDRTYGETILLSPKIVCDIKKISSIPLDIHMYVDRPEYYFKEFFEVLDKNDYINIEIESVNNISFLLETIARQGIKTGVSIDMGTPLCFLEPIIDQVDLINILVRNTGNKGEDISNVILERVTTVRNMIEASNRNILLEVDGSVTLTDTKILYNQGANCFVYGTKVIFREGISYLESVKEVHDFLDG